MTPTASRYARRALSLAASLVAVLVASTLGAVAAPTLHAPTLHAQTVRVSADTTKLKPDARAALRTWREYLQSKRGQYFTNANTPSPLWLQAEQKKWPSYDLAALYLLDGTNADVVRIEPVSTNAADGFRITTRFTIATPDTSLPEYWRDISANVYTVQENGEWKMSNALVRTTAAFKRDTVRSVEFVHRAETPFNRARAELAVAFIDSLADVLAVPRVEQLSYYMFNSLDDAYASIGIETTQKFGAVAGMAQPVNNLLFSGIPALGENYRHELAHTVLRPLMGGGTSTFVSEGVPTFLGGTGGMDYPTTVAGLAAWLRQHPQVTLDSLMRPGYANAQTYPAAAVVAEMVNDVGGRHGLKLMFDAGASAPELREGLQRITKFGWSRILQEWRDRVFDYEKK